MLKENKGLSRGMFLGLSLLVLFGIILSIRFFRFSNEKKEVIVGAVFLGSCDDKGWNQSHYDGIKQACEGQDCALLIEENVPEEEEEKLRLAVNRLVEKGCSVLFLTSFGYGNFLNQIASENPMVAFYCISGNGAAENAAAYFPRIYQARYLEGIVAGAASRTGILGMVSSMSNAETRRLVNAYTLGARLSNPQAKVIVYYTGSWDDDKAEEKAVEKLVERGVDTISYHLDTPHVAELAEEKGLFVTGYGEVYGEYSERFLTAALFEWDIVYQKVLGDYLSGRANFSYNYWLGLSDEAVSLYPLSPLVEQRTKNIVEGEKARIQTQRDVFSGKIYDNKGKVRCEQDERISDDELFYGMAWYVAGVEIYE